MRTEIDRLVGTCEESLIPATLTSRARGFVSGYGHRVPGGMTDASRDRWQRDGVPAGVIEQMAAFDAEWGGLLLPPASYYNGGPKVLRSDLPRVNAAGEWWFDAGDQRFSMDYSFCIGPHGEFAIDDGIKQVVLHTSVVGWIESLSLAVQAGYWASHITQIHGPDVDYLDLTDLEPFPEAAGVSDTWLRGKETVIAVHRGAARLFNSSDRQVARIYRGLSEDLLPLDF